MVVNVQQQQQNGEKKTPKTKQDPVQFAFYSFLRRISVLLVNWLTLCRVYRSDVRN